MEVVAVSQASSPEQHLHVHVIRKEQGNLLENLQFDSTVYHIVYQSPGYVACQVVFPLKCPEGHPIGKETLGIKGIITIVLDSIPKFD